MVSYTSNEPLNPWVDRTDKEVRGLLQPFNEQSALYLQVAQMLEDGILRGIYPAEEQVPSTNELARAYKINPATAAKGINLLVDQGVLYKRRGIGMFVAPGAAAAIAARRKAAFYQDYVIALAKEAASLGIGAEELAQMVRRAAEHKED